MLLIACILLFAVATLAILKKLRGSQEIDFLNGAQKKPIVAYRLKPALLTPAEKRFALTLCSLPIPHAMVAFKVRLADIFDANNRSAFNRIAAKHVDFLLVDDETSSPLLGIELDDKSHEREDRRTRDTFVDQVFTEAGLPILHVKARASYDTEEILNTINQKLVMEVKG